MYAFLIEAVDHMCAKTKDIHHLHHQHMQHMFTTKAQDRLAEEIMIIATATAAVAGTSASAAASAAERWWLMDREAVLVFLSENVFTAVVTVIVTLLVIILSKLFGADSHWSDEGEGKTAAGEEEEDNVR